MTAVRLPAPVDLPDWGAALCKKTDPRLFFPEDVGAQTSTATAQAKEICGRCPIKDSCLAWALETRQRVGVWGGTDKQDRRRIRLRAALAAKAEAA